MAYTISNIENYKLGYAKGAAAISEGTTEDEALALETNSDIKEGIKVAYKDDLKKAFKDSLTDLKHGIQNNDESLIGHCICDCNDIRSIVRDRYLTILTSQVKDALSFVSDADEYSLNKLDSKHYQVLKNGEPTYELTKKQSRWSCNCTGFKYRGNCKHIALLNALLPKRHNRSEFEGAIPKIEEVFKGFNYAIVGSWRRGKDTFKDVDILVECDRSDMSEILSRLNSDPDYKPTMSGPDIIRGTYQGYDFDVTRANEGEYGTYLLYRTGSSEFNIALRGWLKKYGYRLNEHGLYDANGDKLASSTEQDVFDAIGIDYIKPEDRETAKVLKQELSKLKDGPLKGEKKL